MAKIVAGLSETQPGDGTARRNNVWSRDRDWWYGLKKKTGDLVTYRHLLQLPEGYAADTQKKWPVLLFLHGSGERGDDLERVKVHGPPRLIAEGKHLPFIVVSPQCPTREQWSPLQLNDLLNEVAARYRVDASRIYVTGLSMGGYGTWDLAMQYPEKFAALVPICGAGDAASVALIKNVPTWIFHGAKDEAVPVEEGQKMADAMKRVGAEVKLTVYPEAAHDSWTETYNNPQLYEWLLQHSNLKPSLVTH
jgi:predicted peptidase